MKTYFRKFIKNNFPMYFVKVQSAYQRLKFKYMILLLKAAYKGTPPRLILWPSSKINGDTSQFGQSSLVDLLLTSKNNGIFVDIGANDPRNNSNTYFFEYFRSWTGFAFEPLPLYLSAWKSVRKATVFTSCAIGVSTGEVFLSIGAGAEGWEDQLSTVTTQASGETGHRVKIRRLSDFKLPSHIDFISIDVEGYESEVLEGISWENFSATIICLENCSTITGNLAIREKLTSLGYVYFARIKYIDDVFVHPDFAGRLADKKFLNQVSNYFSVHEIF